MRKNFMVIGLGRFGSNVARELCRLGSNVLAVDKHEENINDIADLVTYAVQADSTEEKALQELDIPSFDCIIISVGNDIRTSVLTTVLCKDLGAKYIISKASDSLHAKLLYKTGADKVIQPEREGGIKLAQSLVSNSIEDFLELSSDYSISEIRLPSKWAGKTLRELDIRAKYGISIIAVRRNGDIIITLSPEMSFDSDDSIIMLGSNEKIGVVAKL